MAESDELMEAIEEALLGLHISACKGCHPEPTYGSSDAEHICRWVRPLLAAETERADYNARECVSMSQEIVRLQNALNDSRTAWTDAVEKVKALEKQLTDIEDNR